MRELRIKIKGDVNVCVPGSINYMTPYILLEQEDWFEEEMEFIRRLAKPGLQVIDVGANYGVYSLVFGKMIGHGGRVWAFEPTSVTADYLRKSINENGLENIELIHAALSEQKGTARLACNPNPETNRLLDREESNNAEIVNVLTLDDCVCKFGWKDIDFVKLDAEGEEVRIVAGGSRFLTENSPLIMFEYCSGHGVNHELTKKFQEHGYDTYYLISGLQVLAPLDAKACKTAGMLNLFCCRPDRAKELASRNLLVSDPEAALDVELLNETDRRLDYILQKAYSPAIKCGWEDVARKSGLPGWDDYQKALSLYCLVHNGDIDCSTRYVGLKKALVLLEQSMVKAADLSRLQSYARILWEFGKREQALGVLKQLIDRLTAGEKWDVNEPFISASPRFDNIPFEIEQQATSWCLCACVEQYESILFFSTYFIQAPDQQKECLNRLDYLHNSPFQTVTMERRYLLLQKRLGMIDVMSCTGLLKKESRDNLNAWIWRAGM